MDRPAKTEKELVEKLTVDLITAAMRVNDCSKTKDMNRNRVNYGIATKCSDVLNFLKIEVNLPCWENEGFLIIERVVISGKETKFF